MISKEDWLKLARARYSAEADQIEKDCLAPQLNEGRIGDSGAVATLNITNRNELTRDILMERLTNAGFRPIIKDGWLLVYLK